MWCISQDFINLHYRTLRRGVWCSVCRSNVAYWIK